MESANFLLHLLAILLAARIFAEIASRLHAPPVIGELVAGIVLGPSVLGLIEPSHTIKLLAEIGIILLLFEIGLETDIRQLAKSGGSSLTVAVGGFVLPFAFGFLVSRFLLDFGMMPSLFIGGTLTATSIGITVRVLADLHRQSSREGQIVLGAAVIDDVLGVVLLALLYQFAIGHGVSLAGAGKVLLFIVIFFVLATPLARFVSVWIQKIDNRSEIPGVIPTTIVSLVLFFAWLAHAVGAPELLGGFAAGLALSRRFVMPFAWALHDDPNFSHRVEEQMRPIGHLFTPIFFVTVGLSLNLREVAWGSGLIWELSAALLVAAVLGKLAGAWLVPESWRRRLMIGVAMVPRGEVGLIFAELGRESQIFDAQIYAGMVIVIALTTLLPPFLMKSLYKRFSSHLSD